MCDFDNTLVDSYHLLCNVNSIYKDKRDVITIKSEKSQSFEFTSFMALHVVLLVFLANQSKGFLICLATL